MTTEETLPGLSLFNPGGTPSVFCIDLTPHFDFCCICGAEVCNGDKAIPMFEGMPVPHDWVGDWAGFCACEVCFEAYERGEMKTL